ncbi:DoxX family protein [Pseudonocardia sp. GCM10023141]|uniref:DoxX family protein n=1 Tax=Pseudonocardia sp. GCM10023141 TaxID=3252653 RepID=UPI00360FB330
MLLRRVARPMLAAIFITGGINALRSPQSHAEVARPVLDAVTPAVENAGDLSPISGMPADESMVKLDAGVKIVAGTLLAVGKFPRLASTALAASLVPTTLAGHRFWEETDPETRTAQQIHFFKNIGLLGGLLIAAADTEAKPSLGWKARRAARRFGDSASSQADALSTTANDVTSRVTDAAHHTSGIAAGLAAGLAGAVSAQTSGAGSDLADRADALQKKAAKRGAELQKAASDHGAAWQKKALKKRAELEKKASKKGTAWQRKAGKRRAVLEKEASKRAASWQKQAAKKRDELEKIARKKGPELADQASRFGHDIAARASAIGSEVAEQAEGVAKDARKRVAALTS